MKSVPPITSEYFEVFIKLITDRFKAKHSLSKMPKSVQFFGYGNYNPEKPNLKSDFECLANDFVNGKYLYDKFRDFYRGKPLITLNQYYQSIILQYIGYESLESFLKAQKFSSAIEKKQFELFNADNKLKTYYYVNYYYGEDNSIYKGETIISDNWKKIKSTFIYPQDDGTLIEHYSFGNIVRRDDTLHIDSKTLLNGKLFEGGRETYYIGHNDPSNIMYLVGAYCTFDIYTNTVAGQSILEKCSSKEEMEKKARSIEIPPYIAMEIRNKRIVNISTTPKNPFEISEQSPYASIYKNLAGFYLLTFRSEQGIKETLSFKISKTNYKVISYSENVYFSNDCFKLSNKGSVVRFSFNLTGIINLDCVKVFFKTYFLNRDNENHEGVYCGIDGENRLIHGKVSLRFSKTKIPT